MFSEACVILFTGGLHPPFGQKPFLLTETPLPERDPPFLTEIPLTETPLLIETPQQRPKRY